MAERLTVDEMVQLLLSYKDVERCEIAGRCIVPLFMEGCFTLGQVVTCHHQNALFLEWLVREVEERRAQDSSVPKGARDLCTIAKHSLDPASTSSKKLPDISEEVYQLPCRPWADEFGRQINENPQLWLVLIERLVRRQRGLPVSDDKLKFFHKK